MTPKKYWIFTCLFIFALAPVSVQVHARDLENPALREGENASEYQPFTENSQLKSLHETPPIQFNKDYPKLDGELPFSPFTLPPREPFIRNRKWNRTRRNGKMPSVSVERPKPMKD
jgi:hypothetical protein